MYVFNKITVNPQLPKRISRLLEISYNLWWSWNTDFLSLFAHMDEETWNRCNKNPVKFLKIISQDKLEQAAEDENFLREYDKIVENFDDYMNSTNTWFKKNYVKNKEDLIAYFSAEYGLDEILPIYSGGLGVLSGDHLKSASDLDIPFVAIGLLYKKGYFNQKINAEGMQETEYKDIDLDNLPIVSVKDENGNDLITYVRFGRKEVYLKVWQIKVGRVTLYLLDSDIPNNDDEIRQITLRLYGGDQEMRIRQEIILGMAGTNLFPKLGLKPTIYHMNEGHSAFVTIELIRDIMETQKVSFNIAKEMVTAKTVFTTHTPVPAGNDIFPIDLVEKYFKDFWGRLGLTREEFLKLGMKSNIQELDSGFNMGILALRIAGKKNGVSKLHGAVSRELFSDVWSEIAPDESPITYVTNGIHTCTWLAQNLKELFNKSLPPYWQDNIHKKEVWEKVYNIPNEAIWREHLIRKERLMTVVKNDYTRRMRAKGMGYEQIKEVTSKLDPNKLTIGFARRFATYKRAALIFKDIERITQICNDPDRPVQIIFAGKAHPADKEGQDIIKYINDISQMPQFKGKVFILENYNLEIARYLVSGVDVWLNNPRRPMEASGTSGQKAAINGVINFSILDGWWAEGYDGENGWAIGTNAEYESYEIQDSADSESIYETLENKIIPMYYKKEENGISNSWVDKMKKSIVTNGWRFSTARMLMDYVNNLYMPLCDLTNNYFSNLDTVMEYNNWKDNMYLNWNDIKINQSENAENITINAGNGIKVSCNVYLPNINRESVDIQVFCGKISESGTIEKIDIIPMELVESKEEEKIYTYKAKIELKTGGNYGYTFRAIPKHQMLLDFANMNLIKWTTK